MPLLYSSFLGGAGGAAGFTPADLFASGEGGAWYDPSDLSTMWQEDTKTTPAAVDQPVGYMQDKSGNSHHLLHATAGQRPTLRQDGSGNYYLDGDGSDDTLGPETIDVAVPCATVICAARIVTASPNGWALVGNRIDQGADVDFALNTSGASQTAWVINQAAGEGLSDSSHIWNNQVQTTAITQDENRVYACDGTGFGGGNMEFPSGLRLFNDRNLSGRYMTGRLYGLILRATPILTLEERNNAEQWLADKAGVAL